MRNQLLLVLMFFLMLIFQGSGNDLVTEYRLLNPVTKPSGLATEKIGRMVEDFKILEADRSISAKILREKPENFTAEIILDAGITLRFALQRFKILTPNVHFVEGTAAGNRNYSFKDSFAAYRGTIIGEPESRVNLNITPSGIYGIFDYSGESWIVAAMNRMEGFSETSHIIYKKSDLKIQNDYSCGTEAFEIPERIIETMSGIEINPEHTRSSDLLEVEIAIESDYDTYSFFNQDLQATTSYLLSLVSTVSFIYTRDLNVKLVVPYLRVWTTAADPYEGESSSTLLHQFRNHWNSQMQFVQRDLAHFIAIRPGGLGGIAYLGVICDSGQGGYGYAFSDINGSYSTLPVYTWDLDVVAHETGHNFGSPHTHNCYWPGGPIDTCVVNDENSSCVSTASPINGTIMSYCHLTGHKRLYFHPLPIGIMRNEAESAPCVNTASQSLVLFTPNGGEQFYTEQEVLIIWGADFTGTVDIEFSRDGGLLWEPVALNVPVEQREFVWKTPYIPTTETGLLKITDTVNLSLADTSDAVFSIRTQLWNFNNLTPETFSSFHVDPGDSNRIQFVWNRAGDVPGITYRWRVFRDVTNRAYVQSDNSGLDTMATLTGNEIDSILTRLNIWSLGDSVWLRWTARAYYGTDSLQSFPLQMINFKRTPTGIFADPESVIPVSYSVSRNYPNPFNPETRIQFQIPENSQVRLEIFNSLGESVALLLNRMITAGTYEIEWAGRNNRGEVLPSGIYIYRLTAKSVNTGRVEFTAHRKMLMVR